MLNRKLILAGVLAAMITAGGCAMFARIENSPPEPEDAYVSVADPAMQLRSWERATAQYGNGNVEAGVTSFLYEPARGQAEWLYVGEEAPLFIGQTAFSPLVLLLGPPWKVVTYTGVTVNPSYTAMPAIGSSATTSKTSTAAPTTQP